MKTNLTGKAAAVAEMLAKAKLAREKNAAKNISLPPNIPSEPQKLSENIAKVIYEIKNTGIDFSMLEPEQKAAVQLAIEGKSFVLTGAAGTGKTTTQKEVIRSLLENNHLPPLLEGTKFLRAGLPSVAIVSFTNVAVGNIKKVVDDILKPHCMSIHKLLEFSPEFYSEEIMENGIMREVKKVRFLPTRHLGNKIRGLKWVIIEEASNVSIELFQLLVNAVEEDCKFIFLGDINQLKPVMSDGILGYKLYEYFKNAPDRIIELKKVHRQALDSNILKFAHKILSGNPSVSTEKMKEEFSGDDLVFSSFPQGLDETSAFDITVKTFKSLIAREQFQKENSMVLIPMGTGGHFNTHELNKEIAQTFSQREQQPVWEIFAGRWKKYLAVNDYIFYDKGWYYIEKIEPNPDYVGKIPRLPTLTMNREGLDIAEKLGNSALESVLDAKGNSKDDEIKNRSSHKVFLRNAKETNDDGSPIIVELNNAGELADSNFAFGYCLTVHKSQGSEWENVYILLHKCHEKMANRELLYTAVTRAKKKLSIIFQDGKNKFDSNSVIRKAILNSSIKGNTLEAKINYFAEKIIAKERIAVFKAGLTK